MPPTVEVLSARVRLLGSGAEHQHGYEWPASYELRTIAADVGTVRAIKHVVDMAALAATATLRHAGAGPLALSILVPATVDCKEGKYNPMWAAVGRPRRGRFTRLALAEPAIVSLLRIPDELDYLGLQCGTVCADELTWCSGRWQIRSGELAAPVGALFHCGEHHPPSCSGSTDPDTQRLLTLYAVLATVAAAAEVRVSAVLDSRAIEDIRSAAPAVHPRYRAVFIALTDRWADCWLRSAPLDMRLPALLPPPLPAWQPLPLSSLVTDVE